MTTLKKSLFLLLLLLSITTSMFAQQTNAEKITQQFYIAYLNNSNPAWKISLEQAAEMKTEKPQLLLAKGYYGAAGTAIGNQEEELAETMLNKAEMLAEKILENNKNSAEGNSLLSAIYGLKIGLSPMKGMLLGGKSSKLANKGVEVDPENGFANYVIGNNLFYTPSMFGGDVKKSITYFEKAKLIFEQKKQIHTWEYMATMATLGQAYHYQKEFAKAKITYEEALQIAPNFGWIKQVLLPKTEKEIKS